MACCEVEEVVDVCNGRMDDDIQQRGDRGVATIRVSHNHNIQLLVGCGGSLAEGELGGWWGLDITNDSVLGCVGTLVGLVEFVEVLLGVGCDLHAVSCWDVVLGDHAPVSLSAFLNSQEELPVLVGDPWSSTEGLGCLLRGFAGVGAEFGIEAATLGGWNEGVLGLGRSWNAGGRARHARWRRRVLGAD